MTNLQYFRKKNNLTQQQLAEITNQSVRYIQNLEQKRANIDSLNLRALLEISNALEIPLKDLLEDEYLKDLLLLNNTYLFNNT